MTGVDQEQLHERLEEVANGEIDATEASIHRVMDMGFDRDTAEKALRKTNLDVNKAIELILSGFEDDGGNIMDNEKNWFESGQSAASSHLVSNDSKLMPATQQYYDHDSWSVVPANKDYSGSRYNPVLESIRDEETPPVLLSSQADSILAPLLSLLHKIPLARRALLNDSKSFNAAYTPNWYISNGPETTNISEEQYVAIALQRIMAYLDGRSSRGAIDISEIDRICYNEDNLPVLEVLLAKLSKTWEDSDFVPVFFSDGENEDKESLRFADLNCDVTAALNETIYTVVDGMVWVPQSEAYMTHISDVICLTIKRDDGISGAGMSLPLVWYPERYSEKVFDYARKSRAIRKELAETRNSFSNDKARTTFHLGKRVSDLLSITEEYMLEQGLTQSESDIKNVRENLVNIGNKYDKDIEDCQEKMKKIDDLFCGKENSDFNLFFPDDEEPKLQPYYLWGIVLSPQEYCFREISDEADETLIDVESDFSNDREHNNGIWWHVSSKGEPFARQLSESEVVSLAKEGTSEFTAQPVTAVYVSKHSLDPKHHIDLNLGLSRFFEMDNKVLSKQRHQGANYGDYLNSGSSSDDENDPQVLPEDPGKKYNANSVEYSHTEDIMEGEIIEISSSSGLEDTESKTHGLMDLSLGETEKLSKSTREN